MSGGGWFDGYSGQSTAQLIALAETYRIDSVVLAFEDAIRMKAGRIGAEQLTHAERVVLAVEALEREVNSDGYLGLFRTAADYVPLLEAALEAIGPGDVAALTRRAVASLSVDGPLTPGSILAAIDKDDDYRDGRLSACDRAYYDTAGDLSEALLSFIRANARDIQLP